MSLLKYFLDEIISKELKRLVRAFILIYTNIYLEYRFSTCASETKMKRSKIYS